MIEGNPICEACPVQCVLTDRSNFIIAKFKAKELTTKQAVGGRISVMSQEANEIGCPKAELERVRTLVQDNTFKVLGKQRTIKYSF